MNIRKARDQQRVIILAFFVPNMLYSFNRSHRNRKMVRDIQSAATRDSMGRRHAFAYWENKGFILFL